MTHTTARTNGRAREVVGFDELTGVWNTSGFVAAATPMFVACQRRDVPLALAYFDLATPHTGYGEETTWPGVLMATAEQLRKTFRASDIIGRLDTGRFAVLLTYCTDDLVTAVEGMRSLTEDTSTSRGLSLTIGVVRSSPDRTLEELMRATDLRMREIKCGPARP